MTIPKEQVLELIDDLGEEVDLEELIYRLYLRQKVAAAEADIAEGRTLSLDEIRARAQEWRK